MGKQLKVSEETKNWKIPYLEVVRRLPNFEPFYGREGKKVILHCPLCNRNTKGVRIHNVFTGVHTRWLCYECQTCYTVFNPCVGEINPED